MGRPSYGNSYYWSTSYNPGATFQFCMPNCTTFAYGRAQELGKGAPVTSFRNANTWHNYLASGWSYRAYDSSYVLKPGDILEWTGNNHVAVVESSGSGVGITVSNSWYTGDDGTASSDRSSSTIGGSTTQDVYNWATANYNYRYYHECSLSTEISSEGGSSPTYILVSPGGSSGGGGGSGSSDSPTFVASTILTNLNSPIVSENLIATLAITSRTYHCYWGTTAEDAAAKSHQFTPTISGTSFSWNIGNTIERLMPNSKQLTLYIYIYTTDSNGYSREYQTVSFTVNVSPTLYKPVITYSNLAFTNTYNNYPIAGHTSATMNYAVSSTAPTGYTNSSTIAATEFTSDQATLTTSTYVVQGTISATLNSSTKGYIFTVDGTSTDSRGISATTSSSEVTVRGFYNPIVSVRKLFRCDDAGNPDDDGEYCRAQFSIDVCNSDINNYVDASNIVVNINNTSYSNAVHLDSEGVYFEFIVGGTLEAEVEYPVTLTLRDDIMVTFSMSSYTTSVLEVTKIPLSLLSNVDNNVGVAFGMNADEENCVEFAPFLNIKATDLASGESVIKSAYDVIYGSNPDFLERIVALETLTTDIVNNQLNNTKYKPVTATQYAQMQTAGTIDNNTVYFVYEAS